jgi:phosphoribosylformimino-5-aminoimidazole carboxamide ribotide isomerase
MFELIPALDLKGGRCVRLQQGLEERATAYGDDPLAMALHWQEQGARRLHVVDLDGAFRGDGKHVEVARSIFRSLAIPVQFGGGLRTLEQVGRVLEMGADRAIIGTAAVEQPDIVEEAVKLYGTAIVVGIDARAGMAAVRGWRDNARITAVELARRVKRCGVERIIYTDIARDGMMRGVNVGETARLARDSGLRVIASGGVSRPEDVRAAWDERCSGIDGIILGRALYEKTIDFRDLCLQLSGWRSDAGEENHSVPRRA